VRSAVPGAGWSRLKQRALALAQPLSAYLELSYRCSWRCAFCYNPRHTGGDELAFREWSQVLDDLRALGTLEVTLTGGEPLAHPSFLAIARAARERRFALRIFTNGSLIGDDMAEAIGELRPLSVELSLHGAHPQTHESLTGTPGSFQSVARAVERLKRRGVPVVLKSLLTNANESELDLMVALAERWAVPHQVDAMISPRDDGDRSPLRHRASEEAVARMYRCVGERRRLPSADRRAGGVNCGLGRITVAVDPEGQVFPCLLWRRASLGNVRQTRLRELWHGSSAREEAARVAVSVNDALRARGGALAQFPYCPALGAQHTGDPNLPDEGTERYAGIVARLRSERPA
jgi:MoaA/NifB/PqqE/SkfB family radical SAM enzyme